MNMSNVVPLFYRDIHPEFTFRSFFCAQTFAFGQISSELKSELEWASNRKKSQAYGVPIEEIMNRPDAWEFCLTELEKSILREYEEGGYGENIACMLSQRPSARAVHSTPSVMHTIISNPSLHFCTHKDIASATRSSLGKARNQSVHALKHASSSEMLCQSPPLLRFLPGASKAPSSSSESNWE